MLLVSNSFSLAVFTSNSKVLYTRRWLGWRTEDSYNNVLIDIHKFTLSSTCFYSLPCTFEHVKIFQDRKIKPNIRMCQKILPRFLKYLEFIRCACSKVYIFHRYFEDTNITHSRFRTYHYTKTNWHYFRDRYNHFILSNF